MTKGEQKALAVAIAKLDAIDEHDPEEAHSKADDVLLDLLVYLAPPDVSAAYRRLVDRCGWWATA